MHGHYLLASIPVSDRVAVQVTFPERDGGAELSGWRNRWGI